jgi:PAS domain S-box-containing protein
MQPIRPMKAEDQPRTIIDAIPALAWSARPDGSAEFFNRRWIEYTGLCTEQARDCAWSVVIHPGDLNTVVDYWRCILDSREPSDIEARLRRFDGEYRWFLFQTSPLRDESGKIVKWYGTNTDIEDRKRAEEELRSCAQTLRLVVDNIPGLIWTTTTAGEVEQVNRQTLDYLGKTLEELKQCPQFIHPDDRERVIARWTAAIESGQPFEITYRLRRADGVYRWFESLGRPLRDGEGRIVRWYNLMTDIEDQKQAEEARRASEHDLKSIIENIPALWCAAPNGDLTYVNQRLLDYTGATLESVVQYGWVNFIHPDDVEPTLQVWAHAVATGQGDQSEYRIRLSDGVYRWFHVVSQPARDSEGRVTRWYGLLIDVDDRKNMEEALRSTQTRLSRATQIAAVGELAASIAHEINQPLAAVMANGHACLRWLSAPSPSLPKARQAAERIVRDAKEAGEVVQRVRALFKRAAPENVALDLNEIICEVLRLLRGEAARRRVGVEADLGKDLALVLGDRVQLQQLLFNLLLNGLEAMDPVVDRSKKLFIRSKRDSPETVLVDVRDYGVGLADPDKVFEAFFTTKESGMGMGLVICRSIVEAHGGRLWIAPCEQPGTTFRFTLPVKTSAGS